MLRSVLTTIWPGMFETVVPETFRARSRRVFYQTLPVSIAVHAVAIAGVAAATLWTIAFPSHSPRMTMPYNLTTLPDPPPPPPPPPAQPAAVPQSRALPVAPSRPIPIVAPTIIPDTIPPVVEPPPPLPLPEPIVEAVKQPAATGPAGGGSSNGSLVGSIGGKLHGTPGGLVFADDGRVHIERGDKLPLFPVDQTYPHYPEEARKKRLEDRVILRYVIGTNGRVIDVSILEHAKERMFDEEAVAAVKAWRFRPLMVNGKRAEVVHELAVNFEFIVR